MKENRKDKGKNREKKDQGEKKGKKRLRYGKKTENERKENRK